MKKILPFLLTVLLVVSFTGMVFARDDAAPAEPDKVVGDDIEVGEGEFKIISMPVVGDDIEIGDDEVKIISIQDPEPERVVGDDIEIGDGEFKIISIQDPEADRVVGDDIDITDDEAKIISIGEDEEKDNNPLTVAAGVSFGLVAAAALVILLKKKA